MTPRAAELLARCSIVAEASAPSYVPRTSRGAPQGNSPHGPPEGTRDWAYALFNDCRSDHDWAQAEAKVAIELQRIAGTLPKPKEANLSPRVRVLAWAGSSTRVVAIALNTSERSVRRWRNEYGLDASTGRPKIGSEQ